MDLHQLRAFEKVVETRSFTRAAERLFLTQPAVSHQIRSLEQELGQVLLQREGRTVVPTDAGQVLCEYARRLLRLAEEAEAEMAALRDGESGKVTVASIGTTSTYVLPDLLHEFRVQHPGVQLSLHTAGGEEVKEMVAHNAADLGILGSHTDTREFTAVPLLTDYTMAVVCPQHRCAARRSASLALLAEEPLILLGGWRSWESHVLSLFARAGVRPKVHLQLDSIEAVKRMVERGLGFAMLPQLAIEAEVSTGTLVPLKLTDAPLMRRTILLIHRRDKHISPAMRGFMDLLRVRLQPAGGGDRA
ncbi:MAG: LysR family transcriptional regulator [Armatimonadetes bacterium]|nr:LysR family transcriptional regulator [Armatimonadota bacterium]